MNALNQIAQHLKVEANNIIKCEEWANVWFVVLAGKCGRFVSKKVVKMEDTHGLTDSRLISRLKRVEQGKSNKDSLEQDLRASLASLALGRDFGESIEDYHLRRPSIKKMVDERKIVLKILAAL